MHKLGKNKKKEIYIFNESCATCIEVNPTNQLLGLLIGWNRERPRRERMNWLIDNVWFERVCVNVYNALKNYLTCACGFVGSP